MDAGGSRRRWINKATDLGLAVLHYLKWLFLLGFLSVGGFFIYKWLNPPPPFVIGAQYPSQVLQPVMADNLPVLLGSLKTGNATPQVDWQPVAKAIGAEKSKSGPLQVIWKTADDLCFQIRSVETEREIALEAFSEKAGHRLFRMPDFLRSSFESKETALRRVSYRLNPEKSWAEYTSLRRETFKSLYLKLLLEEKSIRAIGHVEKLICPLCNGEGRIMIRRPINGTITDVSTTCPLCIGSGAKSLTLPANAKICPDCGGFGRRVVFPESDHSHSEITRPLTSAEIIGKEGLFPEPPGITSCSRCLSRGYVFQPGTR